MPPCHAGEFTRCVFLVDSYRTGNWHCIFTSFGRSSRWRNYQRLSDLYEPIPKPPFGCCAFFGFSNSQPSHQPDDKSPNRLIPFAHFLLQWDIRSARMRYHQVTLFCQQSQDRHWGRIWLQKKAIILSFKKRNCSEPKWTIVEGRAAIRPAPFLSTWTLLAATLASGPYEGRQYPS